MAKTLIKTIAKAMNMVVYGEEDSVANKELFAEAKEHGILIIFGYSDDIIELRGTLYDEIGVFYGKDFTELDEDEIEEFKENQEWESVEILKKLELKAMWHGKIDGKLVKNVEEVPWTYSINLSIPYDDFAVVECKDEELFVAEFCMGLVIDISSII